jgi:hypothetical protein
LLCCSWHAAWCVRAWDERMRVHGEEGLERERTRHDRRSSFRKEFFCFFCFFFLRKILFLTCLQRHRKNPPIQMLAVRSPALSSVLPSAMVSTRRAAPSASKAKGPLSTSLTKKAATAGGKKSVAARGLSVGGQFPSLGKLETDEGTFVDLDVRDLGRRCSRRLRNRASGRGRGAGAGVARRDRMIEAS